MPTLDQAAHMLGISEKTLRKWMKRLGIERTRHPQDWRYWLITPEQLQQIADERAQMPGNSPTFTIASQLDDRRRPTAKNFDGLSSEFGESLHPTPAPRPLRAAAQIGSSLPDGWMSRTDAADLHGIPRSTFRRWCDDGRIETAAETYGGKHGQFAIAQPVTARGLAQLVKLASPRSDFVRCSGCPHDQIAETSDG